jgi:hypothetical protein
MIVAVYGVQALVFILRRKWDMIGWMIFYILAIPARSPSSYHSTRSGEWMISLGDRLVRFLESLGRRSSSIMMYVMC